MWGLEWLAVLSLVSWVRVWGGGGGSEVAKGVCWLLSKRLLHVGAVFPRVR